MEKEELEIWMARLSWAPTLEEWDRLASEFEAALERARENDETV